MAGADNSKVGGLVGQSPACGGIHQSYAKSNVTGGDAAIVGGLVGTSYGEVQQCYVIGDMTGGDRAHTSELVGRNLSPHAPRDCYPSGERQVGSDAPIDTTFREFMQGSLGWNIHDTHPELSDQAPQEQLLADANPPMIWGWNDNRPQLLALPLYKTFFQFPLTKKHYEDIRHMVPSLRILADNDMSYVGDSNEMNFIDLYDDVRVCILYQLQENKSFNLEQVSKLFETFGDQTFRLIHVYDTLKPELLGWLQP